MASPRAGSDLVTRILAGDVRALARAISLVEEDHPAAGEVLRGAFPHAGRAAVLGITGAPGAGKSTLVDRLASRYRAAGQRVGIVAVDPSSAFSGGAILGDRVRMQSHATDDGVFIRSMATRGHLGGLSRAAGDAIDLLDAAGYDPILVETVGVGQDEVEVARLADVVAVVLVPGMGDDIQAIKAGILEIADLFVINKADRPGADRLEAELDQMMVAVSETSRPAVAIVRAVAVRDEGVTDLIREIEVARRRKGPRGLESRRRDRARERFLAVLSRRLLERVLSRAMPEDALEREVDSISERRTDPYSAAERILSRVEVR